MSYNQLKRTIIVANTENRFAGIKVEDYDPGKFIVISYTKGLSTRRIEFTPQGLTIRHRKLFGSKPKEVPMELLINEKPPILSYIQKPTSNPKNFVHLIVSCYDGHTWHEIITLERPLKEAESASIELNEMLGTFHFD